MWLPYSSNGISAVREGESKTRRGAAGAGPADSRAASASRACGRRIGRLDSFAAGRVGRRTKAPAGCRPRGLARFPLRLPYRSIVVVVTMMPVAVAMLVTAVIVLAHDDHVPLLPVRAVPPVTRRHHEHVLGHATHVDRHPRTAPGNRTEPVAAAHPPPHVVGAEHVVVTTRVIHHFHVVHHDVVRRDPELDGRWRRAAAQAHLEPEPGLRLGV